MILPIRGMFCVKAEDNTFCSSLLKITWPCLDLHGNKLTSWLPANDDFNMGIDPTIMEWLFPENPAQLLVDNCAYGVDTNCPYLITSRHFHVFSTTLIQ